jgi:NADH:ubiquinone oxidoreductase subunit 6 (subunit J)
LSQVLFFLTAIGALTGAVGVVMLRNPFYGVLSLAFHLVCLAGLFLLLRAEFVAFVQVVVYAGAVMVLYVFVVAYVGGGQSLPSGAVLRVLGPLFAAGLAAELCIAMLGSALQGIHSRGAPFIQGFGTPAHIGKLLLTTYLFPFEAASILLLVAAVGAVVLARRRRGLEGDESPPITVSAPRPAYTGTMAEAAGVRPAGHEEPMEPEGESVGGPPRTTTQGGW